MAVTRQSLIAVLVEAGKTPIQISEALDQAGFAQLSIAETAILTGTVVSPKETAEAVTKLATSQVPKNEEAEETAGVGASAIPSSKQDALKHKLLKVKGNKDGKDITEVHAMMTSMMYQMVDVMKVIDQEKYQEYRAIKYPGGNESLATEETKRKAYLFAFAYMYDHFKV